MCANRLTAADSANLDESLNTTVVFKNLSTQQGTAALMECLICPDCQTVNQLSWLFCPKCGKKVDASFSQVMERADQAPTVVAPMIPLQPPTQNPLRTVLADFPPQDSPPAAGNLEDAGFVPQQPAELSFQPEPQQSLSPTAPQATELLPNHAVSTADKANGAAGKEPTTAEPYLRAETITCDECGSDNSSEFSFCLSCGAGLPVTKTIVMASIRTRLKPRLRLLVAGKISGPSYEIKKEARIGRTEGTITFPDDALMSSTHARIVQSDKDFILTDDASSNGTFIKIKEEIKLESGDVIMVGGQLFRFEA